MTTAHLAHGMLLPVAPTPIASGVSDCLGRFDELLLDLDAHEEYEPFSKATSDALGRFKIWSSNIGAHRTGKRSLDHRLRDASHLKEQVLRLLTSLTDNLGDTREIASGARVPWDQLQLSDSDTDEEDDSEDDSDTDTDTVSPLYQGVQYKTEMEQILAGINEAIVNLLRLSATIRNPARHDQYLNFSKSFDTTPFEPFDIGHVSAKYPHISRHLASRLGTALSRRRCYFKYREGHRNKLAAGLIVEDRNDESTVASSLPEVHKVSAVGVSMMNDDDNQSDGGFTATSFASSLADTAALRIPPLPTNAIYDKHFECPLCYNIVMMSNRATWKKHVYSDLQPYMCLWESCPLGRRMFSTRHEWLQHEQDYHGKIWTCCLGCSDSFKDRHTMQDHYASKHSAQTERQIQKIIQASETQKSGSGTYTCPMCSTETSSNKAYAKHTGRHLRELALFALPAYPTEEEATDDESDDASDNESTKEFGVADDVLESESVGYESPVPRQADDEEEVPAIPLDESETLHSRAPSVGFQTEAPWGGLIRSLSVERMIQEERDREERENSSAGPGFEISDYTFLNSTTAYRKVAYERAENERHEDESGWMTPTENDYIEFEKGLIKKATLQMIGRGEDEDISPLRNTKPGDQADLEFAPEDENSTVVDKTLRNDRPIYVKVHKEHLAVDTLIYYDIPYELDRTNPDYIVILQEMDDRDTEVLFEHTRRLRAGAISRALFAEHREGTWVRRKKQPEHQGPTKRSARSLPGT